MKNFVIGLALIIALGVVLYFAPRNAQTQPDDNNNQVLVADYASCVAAGYPINKIKPPTCTTPDGRTFTETVVEGDVVIETPVVGQLVTSPMTIKGKVRGFWFWEANLPIELQDENGKVIAQKAYMTSDEWMTENYVNIDTTLSFKVPTTDYGKLIIRKDNASGLPEHDASFEVPVRFK